jgi:hypothetical protein
MPNNKTFDEFVEDGIVIFTAGRHFAIVDETDWSEMSKHKWYSERRRYTHYVRKSSPPRERLHQFIVSVPQGKDIDHINGDGLDNRKCNLRICTRSENAANKCKYKKTRSRFKGVGWHKRGRKWEAQIMCNYKKIYLGLFDSELEAAQAYNKKALALFGEHAYLNDVRALEEDT